jgi:transposase
MPAPYSIDLRWRIVRACERGTQSQREIAEVFEVSLATVENLFRRYRRTGEVAPHTHKGGPGGALNAQAREQLRQWVKQQPDITLAELRERFAHGGITISVPTLCRILLALGLRRKKRRSMPASGAPRASAGRGCDTVATSAVTRSSG